MKTLKKLVPDPWVIPSMLVIGGIGGAVMGKLVPGVLSTVASYVPTLGSGNGGG